MIHRDPSKYSPSTHFLQMCRQRDAPKPSTEIAAECIREGKLRPATDVKEDAEDYQVVFEHERGATTWRVVAEARRRAYVEPEATHSLITIYAVNAHGPGFHESALATD